MTTHRHPALGPLALSATFVLLFAACNSGSTSDAGVVDPCGPDGGCDTTLAVDPCPEGRYCVSGPTDRCGTCQLPGELGQLPDRLDRVTCAPDAGCNAVGLVCQKGIFLLPDGGDASVCVYYCLQAADCPSVDTTCLDLGNGVHRFCYYNFCGPGANPPNGTDYYATCNSGGPLKDDAFCVPGEDPTGALIGHCLAGGSVDAGGACQRTRANGDTSAICEIGSLCFIGSSGKSRCMQICAAASPTAPDGGPGCPDPNDICFNEFTPWGYCVQKCSQSTDGGCPTGTQCSLLGQGTYGCLP